MEGYISGLRRQRDRERLRLAWKHCHEKGNYDDICGMLLGTARWESLEYYQQAEYKYYWAKVLGIWYAMFAKGTGVSPPDLPIVVS